MELFELRYAIALSECLNFSRAAERLFITQPTLSQQIRRLEKKLGFPLFKRNSKQVTLTAEGERFIQYAVKAVAAYDELQQEAQNIRQELAGKIIFGASPFMGPIISGDLSRFLTEYPNVDFKFWETTDSALIDMVSQGEIDLAVAALPSALKYQEKFQIYPIQKEYVCVVLTKQHPLAAKSEITLEDILPYKLIFSSARTGLRNMVFSALEAQKLVPQDSFEITNKETRLPFLMEGAVSFSLSAQNSWESHKNILRIPISPHIYSTVSLILLKSKHITPELDALIQIVLQSIRRHFDSLTAERGKHFPSESEN